MEKNKYSITFACYNQVEYTKKCIDSMLKHGTPLDRVVAVDNASSDDTLEYLKSLPLGGVIHNAENLGCGIAWNQGALHQQAEWTVVMNNDVLVSAEWIERLIHAAEKHNLKVASPALGNTDQFGLAVIADEAKGVVERSSRNGPTTMQRQIGFAEAES
ncbi:glycosyltransferase, partial [Burkholderia multivorans]|nr:glycosyltransferase [Burkholderia multivorans]